MIRSESRPYSKNLPSNLIEALLSYDCKFKVRCEADFYGASHMVAEQLGMNKAPNSFSSWSHAPSIKGLKYVDHLIWNKGWLKNKLVVNSEVETFLLGNKVDKVKAVGLPITYVPTQHIVRQEKSTLIMLAHSLPNTKIDHKLMEVIDFCNELREQGNYICFCVHSDCYRDSKVLLELDENNIDWFVGSSVNDWNSLKRMRNVFEYFETVASNTMGSQFFYAQLFGAKFFFSEPYFEYRAEQFENDPVWKNKQEALEYGVKQTTKESVKKKYPEYFLGHKKAVCNRPLAEDECGVNSKVSIEELSNLLGWSFKDRIVCSLPYYVTKLKQKLMNKH